MNIVSKYSIGDEVFYRDKNRNYIIKEIYNLYVTKYMGDEIKTVHRVLYKLDGYYYQVDEHELSLVKSNDKTMKEIDQLIIDINLSQRKFEHLKMLLKHKKESEEING